MSPNASGVTRPCIGRGFTLLEILVTLLILSIMTGITVLTLRDNSNQERLQQSAGELAALIEYQCETAVLSGRAVRMSLDESGYRFESATPTGWQTAADAALRPRSWPMPLGVRLNTEYAAGKPTDEAIVCLPDGTLTPFELHLASTSGDQAKVLGTAAGLVRLQAGPR